MINPVYTAKASASGGRNGKVKSSDGILDFEVRVPKEMGGQGGAYTNPEQLFAAGYAACFDSALNMVIRQAKVKTGTTAVAAEVGIGSNQEGGFGLAVTLKVSVPEVSQEQAEELVNKAHQVCPYSNATRNNIDVVLEVSTEELSVA
ncbi:organic hydroperoxide resistance protein [Catalinimonas niigatensis]|uniref:organic hydroperoxide resistance protein n=1 Tax=Catalinimonas niigatensis TaxID=1397264 RepID=UPI0026652A3E|nr:organic hydroperoxide resistance protein [Catalinimonas niigatensis]WPP53461.1 organic hydroperoxide resistance protein [Catalinimonas niigatensis]